MTRRPVAATAAALAAGFLLAAGASASTPAAASAGGIQTGVWWRDQPDGGAVPGPPHVPPGGLWVSSDPSGPSAVSAVQFTLDAGDSAPILTLHVAQSSNLPDTPAGTGGPRIVACATPAGWQPTTAGTPGPWSAKPAYDCSKAQAPGIPSADGTTLSFDLSGLVAASSAGSAGSASSATVAATLVPVDVANPVVTSSPVPPPAPAPASPVAPPAPAPAPPDPTAPTSPSTFDVTFNPPQPADIAVTSNPAADSSTASASDEPLTGGDLAASGSLSAGASFGTLPSGVTGGAPFAPEPAVSAAPAPVNPAPPAAALAPLPRAVRPAVAAAGHSAARVLSGLIFVALAVWAWRLLPQNVQAAGGRGYLTLYDIPAAGAAGATGASRLATARRVGKPPSLR